MNSCWDQAAAEADLKLKLPDGVEMFFRKILASTEEGFRMGSRGNYSDEEPVHRVRILDDFYLGTFVVTQEQYAAVSALVPELRERAEPSHFKGAGNQRHPVEQVDWREANRFCDWLTRNIAKEALPAGGPWRFCLPTEAEWEYACRAETDTEYHNGDGEAALAEVGWYDGNSGKATHPVDEPVNGTPEKHRFRLFGMHGNVWEWCHDVWDTSAYRKRVDGEIGPGTADRFDDWMKGLESVTDPKDARGRVIRGGSWLDSARWCRSAFRLGGWPGDRHWFRGFRVCLVPGPASQPEAPRAPGVGGRGTRPETDGAGGAGASENPDLAKLHFSGAAGREFLIHPDTGSAPSDPTRQPPSTT